ncbi:hypothetical protein KR026_005546, partial [Drosophila bipectinata]
TPADMLDFLHIPQADPDPIPLAGSPWPIVTIVVGYLLFVFKLGRVFMRNRQPYDLRKVLLVYNLFQVAYNAIYFIVVTYYLGYRGICNLKCIESFPQGHEHKTLERTMHFAYIFNKVIDLMDTVFFVLRKSYKQITFLHVYHHVFMVMGGYVLSRLYGTGGHFNALAFLNTFVHVVMYFYYFLSSQYPGVKASIWWKKYITLVQLAQFVILLTYTAYVRFFSPNCGVPRPILYINMLQGLVFIYLFGKFYVRAYLRPAKPQSKAQ